jgi:hypothetical protein
MPGPFSLPEPTSILGYGPTRRECRRAIGNAVGTVFVYVVAETVGAGDHPDAAREVIIERLAVDGLGEGMLDGSYLYVCDGDDADITRGIWSGSFVGGRGSLLLDQPLSAPLVTGTEVEISRPLPGGPWANRRCLNDFVQEALERIVVEARISMVGTGDRSIAIGADYSWLADRDQIIWIEDDRISPSYPGDPSYPSAYPAEIRRSGEAVTLITGDRYRTGETFTLVAAVPADRYVYNGSSWGYSPRNTPGLRGDLWQTAAPLGWVVPFGAAKALEYMLHELRTSQSLPDKAQDRLIAAHEILYEKYVTAAAEIKSRAFPKSPYERAEQPYAYVQATPRWRR